MKRWLGCGLVGGLIATGSLVAAGWGIVTYQRLLREELRVESCWTGIENLCQRRHALVPQLLSAIGRRSTPGRTEDLQAALDAATRLVLSPELINDPSRFAEFRESQTLLADRLATELDRIRGRNPASRRDVERLVSELQATLDRWPAEARRYDEATERFNRCRERFPASVIARLLGVEAKPRLNQAGDIVAGSPTAEPAS